MTFADKVISFLHNLEFTGTLPPDIRLMNPFRENPVIMNVVKEFYRKFYSDNNSRHLILGINPGRYGAGTTGIPFTDTRRLSEKCGIELPGVRTFEPSSVFMYDMIDAYGGTARFYSDFYISAVAPLGFTVSGRKNEQVNFNYYDSNQLANAIRGFIKECIEIQLEFGIEKDVCFCLGTGKNFRYLDEFNSVNGYFEKIVPLEHPRYIMQYKNKEKEFYVLKYIDTLRSVLH